MCSKTTKGLPNFDLMRAERFKTVPKNGSKWKSYLTLFWLMFNFLSRLFLQPVKGGDTQNIVGKSLQCHQPGRLYWKKLIRFGSPEVSPPPTEDRGHSKVIQIVPLYFNCGKVSKQDGSESNMTHKRGLYTRGSQIQSSRAAIQPGFLSYRVHTPLTWEHT